MVGHGLERREILVGEASRFASSSRAEPGETGRGRNGSAVRRVGVSAKLNGGAWIGASRNPCRRSVPLCFFKPGQTGGNGPGEKRFGGRRVGVSAKLNGGGVAWGETVRREGADGRVGVRGMLIWSCSKEKRWQLKTLLRARTRGCDDLDDIL